MILNYNTTFKRVDELVQFILDTSYEHESRLGITSEIIGATLVFQQNDIPYRIGMTRRLGIVELLQVLSGYFDERHIAKVAPNLKYKYGLTHAYGIKIFHQLPKVINQLADNPETRRAILYIGKPEDGQEEEKPCMQMLQFQIRDKHLYTSVYARSWDAVSGLPYDVMVINGLSQVIGNLLDLYMGFTIFHIGSLHVYHEAWSEILKNHADKILRPMPYNSFLIQKYFNKFNEVREWAINQLNNVDTWDKGLPFGVIND